MPSDFSERMKLLSESTTLKLNARVQDLKKSGVAVLNLTAGEPDFPPFTEAKDAVIRALEKNDAKYTPTAGKAELRQAIADQFFGGAKPSQVVVSNGGKQAIFNAIQVLVDPSDEVLIPAPYWVSYPHMVRFAQGKPRFIETQFSQHYKITEKDLEQAITPRTKLLILNSPSNPTGAVYTRQEYERLGAVLQKHPHVWIISDEIYDRLVYSADGFVSFSQACPGLRDRTVTVNGLSKSGAMTGWRIGWSVGPESFQVKTNILQGHSTSGICSLAQEAALAVLALPRERFDVRQAEYLHRRDLAMAVLRQSAKIKVSPPDGAFYFFCDVQEALLSDETVDQFAEKLLESAGVAVVPSTDFGCLSAIRISFATQPETLLEGCRRLVHFVESRSQG